MSNINRDWHTANPMPQNATLEQRIKWHLRHNKNCHCRDIPDKIKKAIKDKKNKT